MQLTQTKRKSPSYIFLKVQKLSILKGLITGNDSFLVQRKNASHHDMHSFDIKFVLH